MQLQDEVSDNSGFDFRFGWNSPLPSFARLREQNPPSPKGEGFFCFLSDFFSRRFRRNLSNNKGSWCSLPSFARLREQKPPSPNGEGKDMFSKQTIKKGFFDLRRQGYAALGRVRYDVDVDVNRTQSLMPVTSVTGSENAMPCPGVSSPTFL